MNDENVIIKGKEYNFDWRHYIIKNRDLQKHKIKSEQQAIHHFRIHGHKENREFNGENYKTKKIYLSNDYTFIILRCVKNKKFSNLWIQCYLSIRKFHPNNKIIIIDNGSNYQFIENINLEKTTIIHHNKNKSGEILPFYYFLQQKWSKYMIYLHDSMFLNRPLCSEKLNVKQFRFFWHFYPGCHDDQRIIKHQLNVLENSEPLENLFSNKYRPDWFGCFGLSCVMSLEFLEFIEKKHRITNLVNHVNNRNDRKGLERILGLLCSYYDLNAVADSYFGPVCICPNFGKNIYEHHIQQTENVKLWNKLFNIGKIFVSR